MPKFFNFRGIYFVFVLITLYFSKFWTFSVLISVLFVVYIAESFGIGNRKRARKPGTISNSKYYVISRTTVKQNKSCLPDVEYSNERFNEILKSKIDTSFRRPSNSLSDSYTPISSGYSFLKSNSSVSSVGMFDSVGNLSPVRRQPLRSRNSIDNETKNGNVSPFRTAVRDCTDSELSRSMSHEANDSGSPNETMSVGEFPLISLVSSLHEAVSPKTHRLKPSPVTIRIQPIQTTEQQNEIQIDPVVAVLKQISSSKRVLAPSTVPQLEEDYQEKRLRSMPRHDLTHSLLESQLTINSPRETTTSKREREETHCPVSSPGGTISGTAPKRICARSLRSNEILSSLSSSICLSSPPSNKSFTGKRKNISFDKYQKIRKIDEESYEDKLVDDSPGKVDKAVTAEVTAEKKSPSLPVINIKRDEISERVVSRAMVSALLRSAVAKLIMSGDPAVYPVPNGSQPRLPEVTLAEFGPPKPAETAGTSVMSPVSPSTGFTASLPSSSKPLLPLTSVPTPTTQPSSGFNFGLQQTSGVSLVPTQTVTTTSVQSSSGGSLVQTSSSLTKPLVSASAVPSFGLSATSSGAPTTSSSLQLGGTTITSSTTTSTLPAFGLPPTSSVQNFGQTTTAAPVPVFGQTSALPSTGFNFGTSTTTSLPSSIPLTSTSANKPPSFGTMATTASTTNVTPKLPSFGLVSTASSVPSTASPVPSTTSTSTFSFGNSLSQSSLIKSTTATTVAPPIFSTVTVSSAPTNLNQTTTTSSNIFGSNFMSNSTGGTASPFFGTSRLGDKSTNDTSKITSVINPLTTVSSSNAATSGNVTSSAPLFNTSSPLTSSNTKPLFGGEASVATTLPTTNPIFGSSLAANKPLFGTNTQTPAPIFGTNNTSTSSSDVFGSTASTVLGPMFGVSTPTSTAAPIFGASTATTASSNPVFGSFSTATTTAPSNVFGGINNATTSASTTATIFGATNPPPNPIFGSNTVTTTSSSNIFGSVTNTTSQLFTGTSTVATTTPIFGGSSTSGNAASIFGVVNTTAAATTTSTPIFGSSGFGGSTAGKTSEGLFGMPSSNSGFKATSPFQVGGGSDSGAPAFNTTATSGKLFDSAAPKPASGGFTYKPSGNASWTPFAGQPSQTSAPSFAGPPSTQTPFSFTGSATSAPGQGGSSSPFVFSSSAALSSANNNNAAPTAVKPFQFASAAETFGGAAAAASTAPSFGQSFTSFGQSAAGGIQPAGFGQPSSPAPGAFQFNATQPAAPGATGGLFSIGTGSSGTRSRDRRERRRRV